MLLKEVTDVSSRSMTVLAMLVVVCAPQLSAAAPSDRGESAAQTMPARQSARSIINRFGFDQRPSYLEAGLERYGFAETYSRSVMGRHYETELSGLGEPRRGRADHAEFAVRLLYTGGPRTPAWAVRMEALADGRLAYRAAASASPGYARSHSGPIGFQRSGILDLDESIRVRELALRTRRDYLRAPFLTFVGADGYQLFAEIVSGDRSTFMALFSPEKDDLPALFALERRLLQAAGIWRPLRSQPAQVVRGPWESPGTGAYCAEPLAVVGGSSDAERLDAARKWMRRRYAAADPIRDSSGFCWATLGMLPRYGIGRHIKLATRDESGRPVERYFRLLPPGPRTEYLLERWGPNWARWATSVWPPADE